MPLPKSSSIAAKATEVYTEVWSVILQQCWSMPPSRENDLTDLSQLLPYLRQLLTCCACAGLLEDAMISLSCGHCYCSECQFRDPLLKIQCRQCRDRTGLVIETQLRVVVKCYRHMCNILADKVESDPIILKHLGHLDQSNHDGTVSSDDIENKSNEKPNKKSSRKTTTGTPSANTNPIVEILREIQDGEKVSRAVLVVKPPQKYLTPKLGTPKKEQAPPPVLRASKPKRALDLSSESPAKEKPALQHQKDDDTLRTSSLISHRISSLKSSSRKRKSLIKTRHASTPKEPSPKKRRRIVKHLSDSKLETSTEEDEEVDVLSVGDTKPQATELDMLQAKLALDMFQPDLFGVSLSCLNEHFLDVSPGHVSFKQSNNINEPCATELGANVDPNCLKLRKSADGIRERFWDHMCPRVKARRSRAIIDKTIMHQFKLARGIIKSKSKETKIPKLSSLPKLPPPVPFTPPAAPLPAEEYEPPLPDDLSGLVLEKLEGEDPLPYIDRLLFRPPPLYPPPPFGHLPPPPPHSFVHSQPPLYSPMHPEASFPLMMGPIHPLKPPPFPNRPIPKSITKNIIAKSPTTPKKRKTPGYSEDGWRCRCGTNNVMFPEKVCAKGKCPCFSKGIPCKNCLCKHCHNPNNKNDSTE